MRSQAQAERRPTGAEVRVAKALARDRGIGRDWKNFLWAANVALHEATKILLGKR